MSAPTWSIEYARAVVAEWRRQVPSAKLEPWEQQRLEEEIAEAIEDVNQDALELGHASGRGPSLPPRLQVCPAKSFPREPANRGPFY